MCLIDERTGRDRLADDIAAGHVDLAKRVIASLVRRWERFSVRRKDGSWAQWHCADLDDFRADALALWFDTCWPSQWNRNVLTGDMTVEQCIVGAAVDACWSVRRGAKVAPTRSHGYVDMLDGAARRHDVDADIMAAPGEKSGYAGPDFADMLERIPAEYRAIAGCLACGMSQRDTMDLLGVGATRMAAAIATMRREFAEFGRFSRKSGKSVRSAV